MKQCVWQFSVLILLLTRISTTALAEDLDPTVRAFFTNYCVKCHGPKKQEADFRADQLKVSETVSDAEYWQLVLDNLNLGEMPPEDEKQPSEQQLEEITSWIDAELRRARRSSRRWRAARRMSNGSLASCRRLIPTCA